MGHNNTVVPSNWLNRNSNASWDTLWVRGRCALLKPWADKAMLHHRLPAEPHSTTGAVTHIIKQLFEAGIPHVPWGQHRSYRQCY
jgi:hypothetical protein